MLFLVVKIVKIFFKKELFALFPSLHKDWDNSGFNICPRATYDVFSVNTNSSRVPWI